MYTTLNKIREHHPCTEGWKTLLKYLGKTSPDDEPLSLLTILDSNGLDHTLWCFRAVDGFEKEKLLLGVAYAREVEHLMPAESRKALDVFERHGNGLATQEEFDVATAAADAARSAAYAACAVAATRAAAYAACAVACARAAVYAACADAARSAAAHHAWGNAAWGAAHSTIQDKQEFQLRELLEKTCTQL